MPIGRDTRTWIKDMVDKSIRDPRTTIESVREILVALDVEPSIENMFVFQLGTIYGGAVRMERGKLSSILIDRYEEVEIVSLLSKRTNGLAKAFNDSKEK